MRILQISNKAPYPANDGSSIAIYNMALGLIENNVDLTLLTINTKKHFKSDDGVPEEFKKKSHYTSVYKDTNTSITGALINLFSNRSYFESRFFFKEFEDKLIEILGKNHFDVIQLEGLFLCSYIDTIRKYSKAKIALRAHNVEHLIWERHIANEKQPFKRWYLALQNKRLKSFELNAFRNVDAIVCITDADKHIIASSGIVKNITTCITGVNIRDYDQLPSIVKIPRTLFYFGSMDWIPNQEAVDWFIENCWPLIQQKHPDSKFIIAGRNMPARFKQLSKPNVQVIENVPNNKEFYTKYDIMLVPLLSGSGLRIKIIEGLSFGKAIVSTTVGAEGIPVSSEQLTLADDPKDFANAVNELLMNTSLKLELEKKAKKFAEEHLNNKAITANLVTFYRSLNS